MRINQLKIPLFYQYLLSYLLILLIPLSLIGGFVYTYYTAELKRQVTNYNERMMLQLQNNLDSNIKDIVKFSLKLSTESGLTPYALENNYNEYYAKRLLSYPETNVFVDKLFLYLRQREKFYSYQSTYSNEMFLLHEYPCDPSSYKEFIREISTVKKLQIVPLSACTTNGKTKQDGDINILVPIPYGSTFPHSTAIFSLPESSVQHLFQTILNYKNSIAMILDKEGHVISSSSADSALFDDKILHNIPTTGGFGTRLVQYMNEPYYLSYVASEDFELVYLNLIPQHEMMKAVENVKNKAILALGLTLLLGSLLVYFMMRVNYNPLRNLIRWAEQTRGAATQESRGIDKIRSVIRYVDQASDQLRLQLEYSRSLAQTQFLTGWITGNFSDQEQIQQQARQLGIELPPHAAFYAIILQVDQPVRNSALDEFPDFWGEALGAPMNGYKVHLSADKGTVWIIQGDPGQIERSHWEWIQTHLSKRAMCNVHFGIGQAYTDWPHLPQSYLQAYTALYYKPIFGDCSLHFHQDEASERTNVVWYPKAELAKLDLILKQGDPESALQVIDEIMDRIRRNNANYFMAKSICFDIMYTFSKTVLQLETKTDNQTEHTQQMFRIMEINTFEGIQEHTYSFCRDMLDVLKSLSKPRKPELLELIESYIAETAYSNQFSIQGMSRDLSLSTAYLGKYFKEQTGITLLDFVTRSRIERAKRLLAQSDLPLQDIVEQTGSTNVSSFIRKFKKAMAMTPGEYRTLAKEQKSGGGTV